MEMIFAVAALIMGVAVGYNLLVEMLRTAAYNRDNR